MPADGRSAESATGKLPLFVHLYLIAVVVPIGFSLGPVDVTILRLLLLVLLVPLVFRLFAGHFGRVMATDLLFGAHVLWMVVALAVNNPDRVIEQAGSSGTEFLGGYLVGRAFVRTPEAFLSVCRILAAMVCCTLPFALLESVTGRNILLEALSALPGLGSPELVTTDMRMGLHRVQAMFAHPIHYGLFCSIALPLTFVALRSIAGGARFSLISIIIAICTFLSLSSGALLAMLLQGGLIVWSAVFSRVARRWWLLVGLFVLGYIVVDLLSNRTPMRVFMTYATFSPGTAYWRATINEWVLVNIGGSPILGIGMNNWVRPEWMHSGSVDNFWLLMAMRFGIPGFLFLAVGYGAALISIIRRDLSKDLTLTYLRRAWVFLFLGLSLSLYTVHIWGNVYSFVFFMFGSGMWLAQADPSEVPAPVNEGALAPVGSPYSRFRPVRRGGALALQADAHAA